MLVNPRFLTPCATWASKDVSRGPSDSIISLMLIPRHPHPATPKAFRTSALPGLTQSLSTRLKISLDPLVYAFDSPGVMLPFLGQGTEGAERGAKLALIGT